MAKGGSRRTYSRDARGRFASSGSGGIKAKPAPKKAPTRAGNRLNRDNAGKITGIGRDGATARGGRLRTASGNRRATQVARLTRGATAGTMRGNVRRDQGAKARMSGANPKPPGVAGKPVGGESKRVKGGAMKNTMKPPVTLGGLLAAGGNRWQKNNMDRVYFNNLPAKAGLVVDRYKSGNIRSASLRSEGISNSKAGEIVSNLDSTKLFYDRKTRRMVVQPPSANIGRSRQVRTAQQLAQGVSKQVTRQSRMKPTRRKNQKARKV